MKSGAPASAFAGRATPAVERGGGGEGGGLRRDCGGRARDEGRPEHDWARSEGLAEPRLLDGRGAAQGRGHSSVDGQGPDAVGGTEILSPFQPQDQGSRQTSGSRRPVRIYQREGRGVSGGRRTRDIDRR